MDVFGSALATGSQLLRDAALDAAYELGVFDQLPCAPTSRRMRALFDVLVAHGVLVREGDVFARGVVPPRPVVLRAGWGLLAEVIRSDQPLPLERGDALLRYHAHLARVGVEAACELTTLIARLGGGPALLDVGAGTGTYASAWLDADAARRATVVDEAAVIALARAAMARFGDRVAYVEADARDARFEAHDVALLANVLHLHAPDGCAALVATAARAIRPGGRVVIKDLRVDDGRAAPYEGLAFALNMAIYTAGGDVYETSQLRGWLEGAGLVG
ncbi:MAG TPA: methyltransferase, partial [Kofleriaceae bacterium]|nr:methyltransferase [Kofleriaceae bacterium]